MDHFIITIARQYGSGGKTIAEMLAKELNIPCYNREIIKMASEDSGISETLFAEYAEKLNMGPIKKLMKGVYKGEVLSPESAKFVSEDNLFNFQAKIIKGLADTESCIIVGRCANWILRDRTNVVSVFVHADHDFLMEKALERNSMTTKEMEKYIAKVNKHRSEFYKYYTGSEWSDATSYDLCLDSGKLGFDKCAEAIKNYMKIRFDREF